MKTAGTPLRLGAVGILAMIVMGLIAPVATSASASASQTASGTGGKCYEQVIEYRYERPTYTTEYRMLKNTRQRTGNTAPWSDWIPNGGSWHWSADPNEV